MAMWLDLVRGTIHDAPESDDCVQVPVVDGEPHYTQVARSAATAYGRVDSGRFDTSHLSPENTYRIGRDYIAHTLRYGCVLNVVRKLIGAGGSILEMGAGKELPALRTMLMDHSAVTDYKPAVYVAADLNPFKYRPAVNGIDIRLLDCTNLVTHPERVPSGMNFDLVLSFEVLEHMDKADGEKFLDAMFEFAKRKPASTPGAKSWILLSTPVNNGMVAKNHIYEWRRIELARALVKRGGNIINEWGMYANFNDIVPRLSRSEIELWNKMASFHSPHLLACMFAVDKPDIARNITWLVEVS